MKQVNQNDNEMSCSQFPSATYALQHQAVHLRKERLPKEGWVGWVENKRWNEFKRK